MPTRRFYTLPEEKRKRIREAALREFTRVPAEMVSINRIVKEAGISRGSYYTYFENKWDIFLYLLEEVTEEMEECAQKCLQAATGDIWQMMELFLSRLLDMCREMEDGAFLKNVLSDVNQEKIRREFWNRRRKEGRFVKRNSLEETIYQQCGGKSIVWMEREQFSVFLHMLMSLVAMEVRSYIDGEPAQEVCRRFRMQLQILKCGVSIPAVPDGDSEVGVELEAV